MVGDINISFCFIQRNQVNSPGPDPDKKIPDISPITAYQVYEITSSYLTHHGRKDHQQENQQHQEKEKQKSIEAIKKLK
jgi:hypothetical protein